MDDEASPLTLGIGAALLVAAATALVFLVGFLHEHAYYGRLGIPLEQLSFPLEHFMARSFPILLVPVFLFVIFPVLEYMGVLVHKTLALRVDRIKFPKELRRPYQVLSAPAVAAILAIWAGFTAVIGIGDETTRIPFLNITILDAGIFIVLGLLILGVVSAQVRGRESSNYAFFGKTASGHLALCAVAVVGFCLAADSTGRDEASERAWACVPLPAVELSPRPPALEPNRTYWLVARADGALFLRDVWLDGNEGAYVMIPEAIIESATISATAERRSC